MALKIRISFLKDVTEKEPDCPSVRRVPYIIPVCLEVSYSVVENRVTHMSYDLEIERNVVSPLRLLFLS